MWLLYSLAVAHKRQRSTFVSHSTCSFYTLKTTTELDSMDNRTSAFALHSSGMVLNISLNNVRYCPEFCVVFAREAVCVSVSTWSLILEVFHYIFITRQSVHPRHVFIGRLGITKYRPKSKKSDVRPRIPLQIHDPQKSASPPYEQQSTIFAN